MKKFEVIKTKNINKYLIFFKIIIIKFFGFILKPFNHRFFYNICKFICLNDKALIKIQLGKGFFIFKLNDPYYSQLISDYYIYENDIHNFVCKLNNTDFNFYDLGANYGYWSVYLSNIQECKYCVAVEPLAENFHYLQLNNKLNNFRFKTFKRVISNGLNKSIRLFYNPKLPNNVGSSTKQKKGKYQIVKEILVRDIIKKNKFLNIFKLDIEGEEINAIKQITKIKLKKHIIIYECHGKDKMHKVTKYLIKNKYNIYNFSYNNKILNIKDISLLTKIKKKRNTGYNFIAIHKDDKYSNGIINSY